MLKKEQTKSAAQAIHTFAESDEHQPLKRTQLLAPYLQHLGKCYIEQGFAFSTGLNLSIEDEVFINHNVWIDDRQPVSIEAGAFIGPNCELVTQTDTTSGSISIGPRAWLGANVKVYPGVKIGEGAIIGAGATLISDVAAHATLIQGDVAVSFKHSTGHSER